ncbi:hypothetical protein [Phaeodactylibacter xiamenensis]|uniref:hypothetical protein n=1 Tax=Phaeodactylibacter xiamenensis TaxID=1524460 RepID=UPI003CCB9258
MAEEKTGPVTDPTDKNKGPGAKEPRKGQLLTPEQLAERMSQGVPDYFAPSQATSIIQTGIEPSQYDDRYTPYQGDLNRYRAYEQGPLDEFGNALGRFALNTIPGIIGNTAAAFDLINDEEMGNELTRAMNEVKRGVNDMLPIYRKDPGKPLDIGDSAWWFENGSALAGSAVEFLVPGAAISKTLRATKLLAWLGKLPGGAKTRAFGEGLVNNYLLNNAEGVITAMDVYDQVLSDQSIPESKRKKIASDAAAYALNMNRVNMLLNVSSTMAFLKPLRHSRGITKDFTTKAAMKAMAGESAQEYAEEVINHLSVEEGKRYASALAKGEDYEISPENIVKDIFSMEGIEAGLLGAVGGSLQTAGQRFAFDNLKTNNQIKRDADGNPVRKTDEDGNIIPGAYEYDKVSNNDIKRRQWAEYTNKLESLQKTLRANNVGDAVEAFKKASNQQANLYMIDTLEAISDPSMTQADREKVIDFRINNLPGKRAQQERMREELNKLKQLTPLEVEQKHNAYREKTLAAQAYDFFENRGAEGIINEYQSIASLSKEEAAQRGLDPERYQEDARKAIDIIRQAEREYNKIADLTADDVVRRELYNNRVDTFQLDRQISDERKRLVELKQDYETKRNEVMEIMNDGLKEGDHDYVTEDEMLDEFYADEKDALDRSRRRIEELIDRRRKGIEKYKELKDPKNHEKIRREKFQRLQELVQDAMERLNYEKTMRRLSHRTGGDKGETKYNNMLGSVKRWRGRWMFVPRGQENEAGIAGVEITKDNYRELLGLTPAQVRQEDIRTEEGRARLALLNALDEYVKNGRSRVKELEAQIRRDEKDIEKLQKEVRQAAKDLEAYDGDRRMKPYRKLKKQLQDLRERNESLIAKKQDSLVLAQRDIEVIQFALNRIQKEYDYALANIDREGYEAIADRLKAEAEMMPFASDYQGQTTDTGYGRVKDLYDRIAAIEREEQRLASELKATNDNFELLAVSEEYLDTMKELAITMEEQLSTLEEIRKAIDLIMERYGDLAMEGSSNTPSVQALFQLMSTAAQSGITLEEAIADSLSSQSQIITEQQATWFETEEGQRFIDDFQNQAFQDALMRFANAPDYVAQIMDSAAQADLTTLSDALMALNGYIPELSQSLDNAINRYAELRSEQEVLDAIKVDSAKIKALRGATDPMNYSANRFQNVLSLARDLVKKYREEAKMLDNDVKNTKPPQKDQDVDYTEDLDDLQRINNILFGGKFKHTLFSTTGNDRDKEVVRFNRFLARNRKALLKDYAIEFHTVESAREAGLTSLFSKEQLDIDEAGGDKVIKAVFVDKKGNPVKIDTDGMIAAQGVFYATAVIHTPSYDRLNPVAVLNEYLAEHNSTEQVDSEADLATKVITDPVSGKSMNAEDVAKLAIGKMQRQLESFRNDILQKINAGERVFTRPNFISGGVPARSNPINGTRQRESLVGTFVDQIEDIDEIRVVRDGERLLLNGKRTAMRPGSVVAVNKDGDAIDVVPRKLKNEEIDLILDLLDTLLNSGKELNSEVTAILPSGEVVDDRQIAKSSDQYRLLDQLLYFGLNSSDLSNPRAIYFYQGKLVFGDKAIFATDIKKSKELRQFLSDKFHHISAKVAEYHRQNPTATYYHPVKMENGKVIVKAYEPKGEVDGYTRYLVEEKVAASDLTPTSSKAIDNFRHRYATFEAAVKTDIEAFFPKPKPKKQAPKKETKAKGAKGGAVSGNDPVAAANGAVNGSKRKRKKGSSLGGKKPQVTSEQLKQAFEEEGKGEIYEQYEKVNKQAEQAFPGGLGAMASMGEGMIEDVIKKVAKDLGYDLSDKEAKELVDFRKEISQKRKELQNTEGQENKEEEQGSGKVQKRRVKKRKQVFDQEGNQDQGFQVAGDKENPNSNPERDTQEDELKDTCDDEWF